ncbi:MAG: HEAT repeat domain-containing protein [Candidatus Thermoplasmatota archaeon]|nr:HEAT repeat domain-containing protein [Candidatus Thermoplasmatota archaeon]
MSVRPALAKLTHSDVRQRRRAVRHLFELNDPEALEGFAKLLEDPDPWFREKALEAIDKWATSKDLALIEKLSQSGKNSRRLLAARIAIRTGGAGQAILSKLSSDDEANIRLAAWKARINFDESSITEALLVEDRAVRRAVAQRVSSLENVDSGIILQLLSDESETVRASALGIIEANSSTLDKQIEFRLKELIAESKGEVKARMASILLASSPDQIDAWIGDSNTAFVNRFSRSLRDANWASIEGLPENLNSKASEMLLIRLLRGERSESGVNLRNDLLNDEARSEEMRSQLIEDLIGRPIAESTLSIVSSLAKSDKKLLSSSAKNLLAEQ